MRPLHFDSFAIALGMPVGAEWLCILAFLAVLAGSAVYVIRRNQAMGGGGLGPMGFPVLPPTDGPGRFRVAGVRRDTREDAVFTCEADSAANARVKAELDGIVVTDVKRESAN